MTNGGNWSPAVVAEWRLRKPLFLWEEGTGPESLELRIAIKYIHSKLKTSCCFLVFEVSFDPSLILAVSSGDAHRGIKI